MRAVIFAAVSSSPQASEEKASIPSQIENARVTLERRGWDEVCDPLIVPGHTRDIDFLHEAMDAMPAMARLIELAQNKMIDVVVVRDYDRLARTRMLLTSISTYLERCRVQIFALQKPVEPVPIEEFNDNGAAFSSAMVTAFAGLTAEQEVSRLRKRRRMGMNEEMKKGKWKHSAVVYGYTQTSSDGTTLDVPVPVEEEVAVIRRVEEMYLDGKSSKDICRQLNTEDVPSSKGATWQTNTIMNLLKKPFYTGYIVWGIRRREKVFSKEQGTFVSKKRCIPVYDRLWKDLGHRPTTQDILDHQDELRAGGLIIAKGQHEAIRTLERQRNLDRERLSRIRCGGRGATTKGHPKLFTGLTYCGMCDHSYSPTGRQKKHPYIYYRCKIQRLAACSNGNWVREDRLYRVVRENLLHIVEKNSVEDYVDQKAQKKRAIIEERIDGVKLTLASLGRKRKRWDEAYEGEAITLEEYSKRIANLREQRTKLESDLSMLQKKLNKHRNPAEMIKKLTALIEKDALPQPDEILHMSDEKRARLKIHLRRIIDKIIIGPEGVEEIVFA